MAWNGCASTMRSRQCGGQSPTSAILLPRANKEPAYEMLQRLRLRLMECPVRTADGKEFGLTVSIGLASLNPDIRDLRELLRNADAALYRAKREGRNRVEAWFE